MSIAFNILIALLFALIGYRIGWDSAHITVAKECKTLGGFYVGDEVFKCSLVVLRK